MSHQVYHGNAVSLGLRQVNAVDGLFAPQGGLVGCLALWVCLTC